MNSRWVSQAEISLPDFRTRSQALGISFSDSPDLARQPLDKAARLALIALLDLPNSTNTPRQQLIPHCHSLEITPAV